MAGVSIVGQKKPLDERGWESPVCIPNHVADDLSISPDTQDTEDRFYPWENDPLKRSLELSSEPLEGHLEVMWVMFHKILSGLQSRRES